MYRSVVKTIHQSYCSGCLVITRCNNHLMIGSLLYMCCSHYPVRSKQVGLFFSASRGVSSEARCPVGHNHFGSRQSARLTLRTSGSFRSNFLNCCEKNTFQKFVFFLNFLLFLTCSYFVRLATIYHVGVGGASCVSLCLRTSSIVRTVPRSKGSYGR